MIIRFGELSPTTDEFYPVANARVVQPDPGGVLEAWLAEHWEHLIRGWCRSLDLQVTAASNQCPGLVNWSELPIPKPNSWIVPTGLSRAARGVFLFAVEKGEGAGDADLADAIHLQIGESEADVLTWRVEVQQVLRLNHVPWTVASVDGEPLGTARVCAAFVTDNTPRDYMARWAGPSWHRVLDPFDLRRDPIEIDSVFGEPTAWPWQESVAPAVALADVAAWSVGRRLVETRRHGVDLPPWAPTYEEADETRLANMEERECQKRLIVGTRSNGGRRLYTPWVSPSSARPMSQGRRGRWGTYVTHYFGLGFRPGPVSYERVRREWFPTDVASEVGWRNMTRAHDNADYEWRSVDRGREPYESWTFAGICDWRNTGAEDYVAWECWPKPVTRVAAMPWHYGCSWHVATDPDSEPLGDTIVVKIAPQGLGDPLPKVMRATIVEYTSALGGGSWRERAKKPRSVEVLALAPLTQNRRIYDLTTSGQLSPQGVPVDDAVFVAHWSDSVHGYVLGDFHAEAIAEIWKFLSEKFAFPVEPGGWFPPSYPPPNT